MHTERQQTLIAALTRLLDAQPHIQAAWLAGSLGRGEGDEFSDVDILALTADGRAGEVSAALVGSLDTVTKPVLVNRLYDGRVLNEVTEDWDRFDISLVEAADLARHDARDLKPLFQKAGPNPPTRTEAPPIALTRGRSSAWRKSSCACWASRSWWSGAANMKSR